MFIEIVKHTPVWVWGLLTAVLALGYMQTRPRDISLMRITVLPLLLLGLSLSGVFSAFGHFPPGVGGWAAGVGVAFVFARNAVAIRGASWSSSTRLIHVPGSWIPLALIVALFVIKYFAGVQLAMHPALATDAVFAGSCSFGFGLFSGLFLARAMSLRNVASQGKQALNVA